MEVEVNDHYIILYELDGYPVDTQKTRRLYLQSGETAKIGLEQIDTKSDSYFFRVSLPGNKRLVYKFSNDKSNFSLCFSNFDSNKKARASEFDSFAIIQYRKNGGMPDESKANWNIDEIYEAAKNADDIINNPYFFEKQKLITASEGILILTTRYESFRRNFLVLGNIPNTVLIISKLLNIIHLLMMKYIKFI